MAYSSTPEIYSLYAGGGATQEKIKMPSLIQKTL